MFRTVDVSDLDSREKEFTALWKSAKGNGQAVVIPQSDLGILLWEIMWIPGKVEESWLAPRRIAWGMLCKIVNHEQKKWYILLMHP